MLIPFVKMHGARNDFVVVDERDFAVDDAARAARAICDRHAGIGADGVLLVGPGEGTISDASMRVLNADGSEAEMCGNGIRCVARFLSERGDGDSRRIGTKAGVIETHVLSRDPDFLVRVMLGVPTISTRETKFVGPSIVSLGNPHAVFFHDDIDVVDLRAAAHEVTSLPQHRDGINVHVATVEAAQRIRARHFERGVGETMACGTGAVAIAVAAINLGVARSPVDVIVPGGRLTVIWDGRGPAMLEGPAVRIFAATYEYYDAFVHE